MLENEILSAAHFQEQYKQTFFRKLFYIITYDIQNIGNFFNFILFQL